MRRVFNTLLLLIFLFSCGQKNANTEISKDASSTGKDEKVKQYTILPNSTEPTEPQNQAMEADTNCLYENEVSSLGKGLIYAPSVFELYNDSLLTDRFTTVDMHSGHTENNGICSKFFMPEYDIMQFVCLDSSQKSYKVLINYSDFKKHGEIIY